MEAKARADVALNLSQGCDVEFAVAFAQAKLGNTEQAQKQAVALHRQFSEDTAVQRLG